MWTAVGPGCADLVAPVNGRVQYYMSPVDSTLYANVSCDDGYHVDTGASVAAAAAAGSLQHVLHCTGVIWSSSLPLCTPGIIADPP